jgi:DNA primase
MLSQSVRDSLEKATATYAQALHGSVAQQYLVSRGIPVEVQAGFRLGYVVNPAPGDENMVGRLAIPYLTPGGPVALRFRTLTDGPKYLSHVGDKSRLFNVADLHLPSPTICLCEGELDTVVCSGVAGLPAVGVPGVNQWQSFYRILLNDYARVVVLADGDKAGSDFAKRVVDQLSNATVVPMPDGMDVNDFVLTHGVEGLIERVNGG